MKITVNVRRHAKPKKDPKTGASLDELTEEGMQQAKEIGAGLYVPDGEIIGYYSPKHRAYQTLVGIMEGAGVENPVMYEDKRLDTMQMSPEFKKGAFLNPDGSKRSYDAIVQYLIENTDPTGESFADTGKAILQHIIAVYNDLLNLKDGAEIVVESTSHGPKVEAGLINLLGLAGKNITKIEEIGGGFKPGEAFQVHIEYSKSGLFKATTEYRGEKTRVDGLYSLF